MNMNFYHLTNDIITIKSSYDVPIKLLGILTQEQKQKKIMCQYVHTLITNYRTIFESILFVYTTKLLTI